MTLHRSLLAAGLVASLGMAGVACGSTTTASSPPPSSATTTTPASAPPPNQRCASLAAFTSGPVLATAAALTTTVIVAPATAGAPASVCTLFPGTTAHLVVGDRARFVANGPPMFLTANGGVLAVSTVPGPTEIFGGIASHHVVVTLLAQKPGTVRLEWINCSGTAC